MTAAYFDPTLKIWIPNSRRNKNSKVFDPGARKTMAQRRARPITGGETLHVILRSEMAHGRMNLLKHESKISRFVRTHAKSHGVRIHKLANVGNHIHLHLRVTRRLKWKGFISGLSGGIARFAGYRRSSDASVRSTAGKHASVGSGKTGQAETQKGFWKARPYTRTVSLGYDFKLIQDYVEFNQLEAHGVVPPRKQIQNGKSWRRMLALWRDG